MTYIERFTDEDLDKIIDAGLVYMCACPAQLAEALRKLRELHRYQINCLDNPDNSSVVHQTIARYTAITHAQMQDCLDEVLVLEGWDRTTLEMPEGLRARLTIEMLKD